MKLYRGRASVEKTAAWEMPDTGIRRYSRDPIRDKFVERKESMTVFSMSFWVSARMGIVAGRRPEFK